MAKKTEVVGWGETPLEEMNFQAMLDAGVIDIAEVDDVNVVDQAELVGVPFILFEWDVKPSVEYGGHYAVCRVKTAEGTAVFSDGGSGIVDQLERYKAKIADAGSERPMLLYFHYGLRASHYTKNLTDSETGETRSMAATTYYFDNRRRP